jgi:putative Holliday junction resolvase
MKAIALDLGTKTVGVALSDPSGFLASPLVTLRFESEDYDDALNQVEDLLNQNPVDVIILGFPKNMDGTVGYSGERSLFFKEEMEQFTQIPIVLWDERLTSVAAHKILHSNNQKQKKHKAVVDQVAAVQMLQEYLDAQKVKK